MKRSMLFIAAAALLLSTWAGAAEEKVTVFATRANAAEKEAIAAFEAETGIHVEVVEGKPADLIDRIAGGSSGADLFMAVDGGILESAKARGVFATTASATLQETVPDHLRDRDNAWIGVTGRARVIVYARDRVTPDTLTSYRDLADPRWRGRLLVRSSTNLYNISLVAALIEAYGEEEARAFADGVAANLARAPEGGDRDQAKGVAAGVGDVALMNSYYLGAMQNSSDPAEAEVVRSLAVVFPDQDRAGTHLNLCGIGIVRDAPQTGPALRLVEYLLSTPVQEKLSAGSFEYPVNPAARPAPFLVGIGEFKAARIDYARLLDNQIQAKSILEASGWK